MKLVREEVGVKRYNVPTRGSSCADSFPRKPKKASEPR